LLRVRGVRRLVSAQLLIDESTAMTLKAADRRDAPLGFFTTGIAVFVLWNLATAVGALAGDVIGDPATYGLDAAVPAAFLALVWPQLTNLNARMTALAAAALALVLVPSARPGVPVIAAAGVALVSGVLASRRSRAADPARCKTGGER
jgi:predicted branched-subunit amino acid permease